MTTPLLSRSEVLGTSAGETIRTNSAQISYGGAGDDALFVDRSGQPGPSVEYAEPLFVGGSGNDSYWASPSAVSIVVENGGSDDDFFRSTFVPSSSGHTLYQVDGRHLYISGIDFNSAALIVDWQTPGNEIETFQLNGGLFSFEGVSQQFRAYPSYQGDITLQQLVDDVLPANTSITPATFESDIQAIRDRAAQIENPPTVPRSLLPSPSTFNPQQYLASNPDLIAAGLTTTEAATQHWENNGINEGRSADSFDVNHYMASNVDLLRAFGRSRPLTLDHYINQGWAEGRSVDAFDGASYIASHDDLIGAFGANTDAGIAHYVDNGFSEGRSVGFDGYVYLASNTDLIGVVEPTNEAAALHYINFGMAENRPTTGFDWEGYRANYPDLALAFTRIERLYAAHFVRYGFAEGRTA